MKALSNLRIDDDSITYELDSKLINIRKKRNITKRFGINTAVNELAVIYKILDVKEPEDLAALESEIEKFNSRKPIFLSTADDLLSLTALDFYHREISEYAKNHEIFQIFDRVRNRKISIPSTNISYDLDYPLNSAIIDDLEIGDEFDNSKDCYIDYYYPEYKSWDLNQTNLGTLYWLALRFKRVLTEDELQEIIENNDKKRKIHYLFDVIKYLEIEKETINKIFPIQRLNEAIQISAQFLEEINIEAEKFEHGYKIADNLTDSLKSGIEKLITHIETNNTQTHSHTK